MQHQGDRPVRASRPTLLTPDEQAAPERQGILSSLDGMQGQAAAAPRPRPRSRALAWGGAAAGAIAVCGALFLSGGGEERAAPVQVAAAAVAPVAPATPVTQVALPAQVQAQAAPAPAAAVLRDEPAAPAEPMPNPLAGMAPPAAPARHKERSAKADKADKAERREAHAKAAHARAQDKSREKSREAGKEKRAKPGAREQDSDVVLLAALMSHMDPKKGKATPAEQLESCRRYNAAGEEQCRARVCAATGRKEAACKRVPAARADAES